MLFSKFKSVLLIILGSSIVAFGMYNIHAVSHITEGGIIGLNLLLYHWFGISPAFTNFVCSVLCFFAGYKIIGTDFIKKSVIAIVSFSVLYRFFSMFECIYPDIYKFPLVASLLGAVFIGVGTGISIRQNAAICGDDALAMAVSKRMHISIDKVYLISDLTVLFLSLTYIPYGKIVYSLITVVISGRIIRIIKNIK